MTDIIVIGGGAAGCMAALPPARRGARVTLLERNPKLGRKLYITGKGRCNVTNDCAVPQVLRNVPHNSRFLTSAVTRFPPESVKAFFEGEGVPLKTERGGPGISLFRSGRRYHRRPAARPAPGPRGDRAGPGLPGFCWRRAHSPG